MVMGQLKTRSKLSGTTKAAKQGNAQAQNNLGAAYANVEGVIQDYARVGTARLQNKEMRMLKNIQDFFMKMVGVTQDYKKAFEWYE